MAKIHNVVFEIAASMKSSFSTAFNGADQQIQKLSSHINQLSTNQKLIGNFQKIQSSVQQTSTKLSQAQNNVKSLRQEISQTTNPSQQLINKFNQAQASAGRLNQQLTQQRQALGSARNSMQQSGLTTKNLAQQHQNLAQQIAKTQQQQAKLAQIQSAQKATQTKRSEIKGEMVDTAGMAMMFAAPIREAMKFESAMADVKKVVDFPTPAGFQQFQSEILKMSSSLPVSAEGLASIAAAAGQAGIPLKDITKFTADAAKMGIAFDVSADQAGEMMAKWRTSFKIGQTEVVGLADRINYLSNVTAASSKDISDIVTAVGPLGNVAGVTAQNIAAIGATMTSVGVKSDVAATGIQNLMLGLVAGDKATKSQIEGFEKLGLSVTTTAKNMQKDATGTMIDLFARIKKLAPEQQASVLTSIFGKESVKAIAPMLTSLDELKSNFDRVGNAATSAGSMQNEFASRSATTANSMQLMKNNLSSLAINVGTVLLPPLNSLITTVNNLMNNSIIPFVEKNKELIKIVGMAAGGLIGLKAAGLVTGFVFQYFKGIMLGVKGVVLAGRIAWGLYAGTQTLASVATGKFGLISKAAAAAQWVMNAALSANPIGLVIAGVIALVGAMVWFTTSTNTGRAMVAWFGEQIFNTVNAATAVFNSLWSGLGAGIEMVKGWFTGLVDWIMSKVDAVMGIVNKVKGVFGGGGAQPAIVGAAAGAMPVQAGGGLNMLKGANIAEQNKKINNAQQSKNVSSQQTINHSPTVIINGNADKAQVQKGVEQANKGFDQQMKQHQAQKARVAY